MKHLYAPGSSEVVQVDVPSMNFLVIEGEGDPSSSRGYAESVEALFSVSYALKFMVRERTPEINYAVMPLEGLWWSDDMSPLDFRDRTRWKWSNMIMQPEYVTGAMALEAIDVVTRKKRLPMLASVRFDAFAEGLAAQTLHVGPFSAEGPAIAKVHEFIERAGRKPYGRHHEIYLSDVRRVEPAKWKTIIRQPMR